MRRSIRSERHDADRQDQLATDHPDRDTRDHRVVHDSDVAPGTTTGTTTGTTAGTTAGTAPAAVTTERRADVVAREKEEHGGVKVGSAFFGWLTATGMAILLTAVLVAAGTAIGLSAVDDVDQAADQAASQSETIGLVGGIALLVIVFVAYLCGGYVAGRMARFNGLMQGLAVRLWAVVIAVVVAIVGAVADSEYDILSELNSFPRIPGSVEDLDTAGIIAIAAVALASLVGALLGGLLGMRFHRRVDRTGLGR